MMASDEMDRGSGMLDGMSDAGMVPATPTCVDQSVVYPKAVKQLK